ncbi:hypothetical protein [Nostoc sp.]|uniref:hypothetical protein n=1 Tax=Nostoc sp. TaxID=1180 RepID=UPI002FF6C30F
MTKSTGFPLELLTRPATERLAYFENYTVAHPRLKEVYEILMRTIAEPAGASFIFVYGASGVGKTTLRLRVEQKLTELALPKLESDRSCVPVVGVEAVAPEPLKLQLERLLHTRLNCLRGTLNRSQV